MTDYTLMLLRTSNLEAMCIEKHGGPHKILLDDHNARVCIIYGQRYKLNFNGETNRTLYLDKYECKCIDILAN